MLFQMHLFGADMHLQFMEMEVGGVDIRLQTMSMDTPILRASRTYPPRLHTTEDYVGEGLDHFVDVEYLTFMQTMWREEG